ncbi:hypothetical protein EC3234A_141c00010 [Escherichia coli]|nr:hypothetical protein EC3234A_141c00010 [Escherichia coli]
MGATRKHRVIGQGTGQTPGYVVQQRILTAGAGDFFKFTPQDRVVELVLQVIQQRNGLCLRLCRLFDKTAVKQQVTDFVPGGRFPPFRRVAAENVGFLKGRIHVRHQTRTIPCGAFRFFLIGHVHRPAQNICTGGGIRRQTGEGIGTQAFQQVENILPFGTERGFQAQLDIHRVTTVMVVILQDDIQYFVTLFRWQGVPDEFINPLGGKAFVDKGHKGQIGVAVCQHGQLNTVGQHGFPGAGGAQNHFRVFFLQ